MAEQAAGEDEAPSFSSLRSRFEALAAGRQSSSPNNGTDRAAIKMPKVTDETFPSSKAKLTSPVPAKSEQTDASNAKNEGGVANLLQDNNKPSSPLPSPVSLKNVPGVLEALQYAETGGGVEESAPQPPTLPPKTTPPAAQTSVTNAVGTPPPVPERPSANLLATSLVASPPNDDKLLLARSQSSADMHFIPSKGSQDSSFKPPPSPNGKPSAVETIQAKSAAALHRFHSLHTHAASSTAGPSNSSQQPSASSSTASLRKSLIGILPPPQRSATSTFTSKAERLDVPKGRTYDSAGNSGASSPLQVGSQTENSDEYDQTANSSDSEEVEKDVVQAAGPSTTISARASEELPDATRANRKLPHYVPARDISSRGHTSCIAVFGDTLVTGHHDKLKVSRAADDWESVQHYISVGQDRREIKLCALAFRAPGLRQAGVTSPAKDDGRYLWCGTKEGDLLEFDMKESSVTLHKQGAHTAQVVVLRSVGSNMISVDESGKICTWLAPSSSSANGKAASSSASLRDAPVTQRVVFDRHSCPMVIGDELWVTSVAESNSTARTCKVRIYRPFSVDKPFNAVSRPVTIPDSLAAGTLGPITSGAVVPLHAGHVYLGHQSGHISIWNRSTYSCIAVLTTGMSGITSLCGVRGWFLWAGSRQGQIRIFDVREKPWQVVKIFEAHKGSAVTQLVADPSQIEAGKLQVLSSSVEGDVCLWDGLLTSDWMTQELERRLAEYSSFRQLTSLQITFNIDAASTADFDGCELPGLDVLDTMSTMPDVIVVGFQELVDLQDTRIMAKSLLLGGARKSRGHDVGERLSHQARAWTQKISQDIRKKVMQWNEATLTTTQQQQQNGKGGDEKMYELILQDSLVGLFTAVFVKEKETINIREAAIASIKTGFGGRMGNKGAIIASLLIDDTPVAWVNCHLAAGQTHTRERNADLVNIFESRPFSDRASRDALANAPTTQQNKSGHPIIFDAYAGGGDGAMIMPDHEIVFLSGDLNYRIDLGRSKCIELINKREWQTLLARDQLLRQLRDNAGHRLKPFHEAPITFAPTYKFDRKTSTYDTSEKQRVPAFCDRILWYARSDDAHAVECQQYKAERKAVPSDHRPVVGVFTFQIRNSDPVRRTAVLEELQIAWKVAQAERLRAAKEYYVQGR